MAAGDDVGLKRWTEISRRCRSFTEMCDGSWVLSGGGHLLLLLPPSLGHVIDAT